MLIQRFIRRLLARSAVGARANAPKLLIALLILVALPVAAYWRGFGLDQSDVGANASEMVVENIDSTRGTSRLNLVLKEKSGPRRLVVALGPVEAASIVSDLKLPYEVPEVTAYAMTRSIADGLGAKIQRVVVNNATDKAFFAKVVLATDNREIAVDAAPSDAIALAVRAKAPIYADQSVLEKAGIVSGR
jgi:bifunctional DNase/RNase